MFIQKKDVKKYHFGQAITLSDLMEKIEEMIDEKLSFVPEYEYTRMIMRDDAEELLFEIYKLIKNK